MRRYLMIGFLGLLVLVFCTTDASARSKKFQPPEHYISLSFFLNPWNIGYKHLVFRNMYLTGNLDYLSSHSDLVLQAGTVYMIPRKILIFRFFAGGGLEFSRNHGFRYPYVMISTKLWILHFDIVHPLKNKSNPEYRLGFIFSF